MAEISPVDLCVVTDVDRTCYKTGFAKLKFLLAVEEEVGVPTTEISREVDARRDQGKTTQITDWIKEIGAAKHLDNVFQRFVDTTSPEEVLYEDFQPFLDAVEESDVAVAVLLTMGPTLHQEAKICTMGIQNRLPYVIVDPETTPRADVKDWQVRSWRHADSGLIYLPQAHPILWGGAVAVAPPARNAIMVEDKYQAFGTGSSRPEPNNAPGIGGFWIDRPEERMRSLSQAERDMLPESIVYTEGLNAVTAMIRDLHAHEGHPMFRQFTTK